MILLLLLFAGNFTEKVNFRLKKAFYSACEYEHFTFLILKEIPD